MALVNNDPAKLTTYYSILKKEYDKRKTSSGENTLTKNPVWNSKNKYVEIHSQEDRLHVDSNLFLSGKYTPSVMSSLYSKLNFGMDLETGESSKQPFNIQETKGTLKNIDIDTRKYEKSKLGRIMRNKNISSTLNTVSNNIVSMIPGGFSETAGTVANSIAGKVGTFDLYGVQIQPYILMIDSLATGLSINTGLLNASIQSMGSGLENSSNQSSLTLGSNPLWKMIGSPKRAVNSTVHNMFAQNTKGIHKGTFTNASLNIKSALNSARNILHGENVAGNMYDLLGIDVPGFNFELDDMDKVNDAITNNVSDIVENASRYNNIVYPNKEMIKYYSVLSYGQISLLQEKRKFSSAQSNDFVDFREDIQDKDALFVGKRRTDFRYSKINPTNYFGMSDSGKVGLDRRDPTKMHKKELQTYDVFTHDKIELDDKGDMIDTVSVKGKKFRDYIKFVIHDIYNRETMRLRATLTDIQDSATPNWESVEYIGKADPVFIHKNTTRKFNFGFTMAATSRLDVYPMWIKINKLMGLMYPTYYDDRVYHSEISNINGNYPSQSEDGNSQDNKQIESEKYQYEKGRPVSPFIYLTLGDWFVKEPGFLTDLSISVDNDSPWDINLEDDKVVAQLPHVVKISSGFQPLGKRLYQNPNRYMHAQTNFFGWISLNNSYSSKLDVARQDVGNNEQKLKSIIDMGGGGGINSGK